MYRLATALKGYREAGSLNDQINLFGFVDDHTFLTKTGDIGVVLAVKGVDYECLAASEIDNYTKRLESAFRILDEKCRIYQYLFKGSNPAIPSRSHENPIVNAAIENRITASIAVLLFLSAGTVRIVSIRNYLVAFSLLLLVMMLAVDPSLAQERTNPRDAGTDDSRVTTGLLFLLTVAVASFSVGHCRQGFDVSRPIRHLALAAFLLSGAFQTWAMIVNPFFSPVVRIQTERSHHLIVTGPYRLMRHPGYFAMSIAVPTSALAIGSWLALAPAAGFVAVIFRRVRVEDEFLVRNLHGYKKYASLVPSGLPWSTTTRAETNL